ncbi:hypothetical protein [Tranquillimonas alkanivorans]|uniref:Uncharacterized protein n=1 Tax=Tranquillimonas alkanivorans TaxID=441119 RepID=A0A1I5W2A8_9RHOB|nr:hypothetical protein [Tranquillimonas alkanivorans]SFQ13904.1 hypothetical protein SAMN04488047_13911 [Tranquillimonas alkanivorans]
MPGCECEKNQQSAHSPGLVLDEEEIIYCLIHPDLFDAASGELKNKAFSKSILKKSELSVVRKPYSSEADTKANVVDPQVQRNPSRRFCGALTAPTKAIRALAGSSPQDVCVADDGLPGFPAHAHLGFSEEVAAQSKSVLEAVRSNLIDVFNAGGGPRDLKGVYS